MLEFIVFLLSEVSKNKKTIVSRGIHAPNPYSHSSPYLAFPSYLTCPKSSKYFLLTLPLCSLVWAIHFQQIPVPTFFMQYSVRRPLNYVCFKTKKNRSLSFWCIFIFITRMLVYFDNSAAHSLFYLQNTGRALEYFK